MIPDRLPWRHRARPSATLHEIQVRSVKSELVLKMLQNAGSGVKGKFTGQGRRLQERLRRVADTVWPLFNRNCAVRATLSAQLLLMWPGRLRRIRALQCQSSALVIHPAVP
jgi:hypothetical protein